MKSKQLLNCLLSKLIVAIDNLPNNELDKIATGDYSISIKIAKDKFSVSSTNRISEQERIDLSEKLKVCKTREEGFALLNEMLSTRKELECFARYLDISILKQDKVDQIRSKIIESTIGAFLGSNAIHGKGI